MFASSILRSSVGGAQKRCHWVIVNPVEVVLTLVGRGDSGEVVRANVLWEDAVVAGLAQAPTHMANH